MSETVRTFESLPMETQQAIAKDWLERRKTGLMRGEGIAVHYKFLMWVSEEYGISFDDLISGEES